MVGLIVGIILILVGAYGLLGAQPFVHWAARLWPHPRHGAQVGNLVATNFIIRFLGLLVVAAGVILVVLYFV
ncbi:MAG TPA: hypothetical protein VLS92_05040 [Acidimicrobiia bacterium]|nr:hypothetical protein [Acidimicrobiia bacterium]